MKVGRLLLRATVGGFFVGHGTQKLFGWFGGQGLQATASGFDSMGLKPGRVNAIAAGASEAFGGLGLLLGYRTPLAASAVVGTMITAVDRVHLKNGPWVQKGGYEYNAVLAAAAISLAESGPGVLSLDALRGKERKGALWGIVSLLLGVAGAAGVRLFVDSRSGSDKASSQPHDAADPAADAAAAAAAAEDAASVA